MAVTVQTPDSLPPVADLLTDLQGQIPNGVAVKVRTTVGENIDVGVVGG